MDGLRHLEGRNDRGGRNGGEKGRRRSGVEKRREVKLHREGATLTCFHFKLTLVDCVNQIVDGVQTLKMSRENYADIISLHNLLVVLV